MATIYIFTFPNGKQYVGQTTNLKNRFYSYGKQTVAYAIKKYGWKNVEKEIEENIPEEFLDFIEISMIQSCGSFSPNGYNMETGGCKNKHASKKTKEKQSKAKKGKNHPKFGKKDSEETLIKKSESQKGNRNSLGHVQSINHIAKRIESIIGIPKSNETKKKISEAHNKKVYQFSKDGNLIKEWESIKIAEKKLVISHISNAVNGERKSAGGFIWKFV